APTGPPSLVSCPSASWTRSGSTASSQVASATGTLRFTAAPPSIFGGPPVTLPSDADRLQRPRHLKVPPAPGQALHTCEVLAALTCRQALGRGCRWSRLPVRRRFCREPSL